MFKIKLNLRLLDAGAEGGVAPTTGNEGGDKPEVVYGKQDGGGDDPVAQGQSSGRDLDAEFDKLIKGEYKDAYSQRIQDTISQRFKNQKDLTGQLESYNEALTPLFDHYGVDNGDIDGLKEALQNDDALYQDEADERGLSVEDLKYIKGLEAAQERNARLQEQLQAEQAADEKYHQWLDEAEEVAKLYPGFDLKAEVENEDFLKLLDMDWSVKRAYEACHTEDLLASAVGTAHHAAMKAITDNIRARGMRPSENGLGSKAGVVIKDDPSKYTDDDIKEIIARVNRGEKIRL